MDGGGLLSPRPQFCSCINDSNGNLHGVDLAGFLTRGSGQLEGSWPKYHGHKGQKGKRRTGSMEIPGVLGQDGVCQRETARRQEVTSAGGK